jgi:two-component sensor histidine kinase
MVGGDAVRAASIAGTPFAYAAAPLDGNLRLLVGEPAGDDLERARAVLQWRLGELCILLLLGMAAVAVGADRAVVRPLNRLAAGVSRWRAGASFAPSAMEGEPQEVRDLSQSFAQAVAALAQHEAQLRRALEHQDLLMQEIHHRVKNNLQIIASLLNLQITRIRSPAARAEFQAVRDRVRALATLHRHLYARGDVHSLNMRAFLAELCGQLLQAMGEPADGQNGRIRLEIDAPELQISSDQAVPIALIVTEAVGNAAKYAFPHGRAGHIRVQLTATEEEILLEIADDGIGLVEPVPGSGTEHDGIGLQLIRGFARQLGATVELTGEGGTRCALRIPLHHVPGGAEVEMAAEASQVAG